MAVVEIWKCKKTGEEFQVLRLEHEVLTKVVCPFHGDFETEKVG